MRRFFFLIVLLSALPLFGAACINIQLTRDTGGIFVSANGGEDWVASSQVLSTGGGTATLGGTDIIDLATDPQDPQTFYALFRRGGFAVTHDGTKTWEVNQDFSRRNVQALAVSPARVCSVYVATAQSILKTDDCLRSWKTVYIDPRTDATVRSIAIAPTVTYGVADTLYAGLATGEILSSIDGGQTWTAVTRFATEVQKILVDPQNVNRLYAQTKLEGVLTSDDRGKTWTPINDNLVRFLRPQRILDLQIDRTAAGGLIALTEFGIYRSEGAKRAWQSVHIIPAPGSAPITAIAASPKNRQALYYTARTTLYSSTDGGVHWKTTRLPTTRVVSTIIIDPSDPNRMFIATTR